MSISPSSSLLNTARHSFIDNHGRTLILRGVNLAGSSKFPASQPSYQLNAFWEDAEAGGPSFLHRPFSLDDGSADTHLARLRGWGFRLIRYVVVWEALEHAGPGKYDDEFIGYTVRVLLKLREYGFRVYMDPHQDSWSRFSGGSGAPFWTFHLAGLNPRAFSVTNAAVLHCEFPHPDRPEPEKYPAMVWQTNGNRLAAATMFTLFFAGEEYAPGARVEGMNVQEYLQEHWIEAFGRLADAIAEVPELLDDCVLGWDSMNECVFPRWLRPGAGFIGLADLAAIPPTQSFKKYATPTPLEAMQLGMGANVTVANYDFGGTGCHQHGTVDVAPNGLRAWLDPSAEPEGRSKWGWQRDPQWKLGECLWAQHGVWDPSTGQLLRPDHFATHPQTGTDVNFDADFWLPYWRKFSHRLRRAHPRMISFVAPPVFHAPPQMSEDDSRGRACLTPHYYDGLTLLSKNWHIWNAHTVGLERGKVGVVAAAKLGTGGIRRGLLEQLTELKDDALGGLSSQDSGGPEYPAVIGEIGIPFDMNDGASYRGKLKGDYTKQEQALDASLNACDGVNGLGYTLWAYNPDNSHLWGDGFNGEDLSLWSIDDCRAMDFGSSQVDADGVLEDETKPLSSPGYRPRSLFELLTNGGRAVRAFCRPYALATVGMYKKMQFALEKPEFEYHVALDGACLRPGAEHLATEIFLPYVHFALEEDELAWDGACPPEHVQSVKDEEALSGGGRKFRLLGAKDPEEPLGLGNWKSGWARLDLQVEVSCGEVQVEGQVLSWRYAGAGGAGAGAEGRTEWDVVWIRVRKGGWREEEKRKGGILHRVKEKLLPS
ncbi:glycoside hydrolase family 5 protein [Calocera cornea HHB12733]|uniref:Glycoside hydrolase family 5 protein n=1 Tax=Calocera cornea HHB12733 TaxID=1353952 RepID=A0A165HVT9_9BASI|nr:glycoside hydrolase family 5 protein [Calocera cornea HHB12733]